MNTYENPDSPKNGFTTKVWTAVAIAASVIVVLLLLWKAVNVLFLILAGAILSVYFHGLAGLLRRRLSVPKKFSLSLSVGITVLFLGGLFALVGARIAEEATSFAEQLPKFIDDASAYVQQNKEVKSIFEEVKSSQTMEKVTPYLTKFFNSSFGFLGDIYVVIFIGVFFTASPVQYKKGMVKLLPAGARREGSEIIELISGNLKAWLKGMLFSMLVVFVLTAIGLVCLGVNLWLILAIIAGLLSFIPNFGPVIAIIPAALVALSQSPETALWVILLYCLVQLIESSFVMPLVQQKLIETPPALLIITQVFMGVWLGGWGVVLATPILVIVMVMVENLYIKKQDRKEKNEQDSLHVG
ncbi:AI-2E family transporter [Sphingobacterium deserti]|uniref:Permease n=1 Tax=Sphingobacterium deserti TaxID=1229276 RepID=A0A0B8T3D0_9SPHI|nr:AI-2E family transporter [Sphingobacterium deserti]KGE13543.1 protein of unknown function UPF0118 [Sphingobacterium deserti]